MFIIKSGLKSKLSSVGKQAFGNAKYQLAKFNWEDPWDFEGLLTEEERMIRDEARKYAQEHLLPRVNEAT